MFEFPLTTSSIYDLWVSIASYVFKGKARRIRTKAFASLNDVFELIVTSELVG